MARTLIGQLILRLRAEGLGEANKVRAALDNVDRAVKRMSGAAGVGSWGIGFQRQLDKLKLAPKEIQAVERSWINLHDSIKNRGLDKAMRGNAISHWKTQTVSQLAQARGDWDRHFASIERKTKAHGARMQGLMKPLFVSMGFYTAAYGGGLMVRGGVKASADRRREYFRQQMAGISEEDQEKIFQGAEQLSQKYPSADITAVMEAARNAYTYMGNMEESAQIMEAMVQGFVVLQSARGPEVAWSQFNKMLRGFDVLGVNEIGELGIDQTKKLIEAIVKAAQVDPEFDPEGYLNFSRRAKTAGPAFSQDFLARAPVYMQDLGSDVTGNALSMAFKAYLLEAVGSAGGKKYLAERERLGIRDGDGLIDGALFGSDPDLWVQKYLVPALKRDRVDVNDNTAVATAVGKTTGNSNAAAMMTRMITQRDQTERWLRLMERSMGIGVAENVRYEDPFVALEAFKSSLQNLASALIPIDSITAGLNSLADGINKLASLGENNPLATALGIGGAGYGMYKTGKWVGGKIADMFGLGTAATQLSVSATMLQRAAIALGGAGAADGLIPDAGGLDKKNPKGRPRRGGGRVPISPGALAVIGTGLVIDSTIDDETKARLQEEANTRAENYQRKLDEIAATIPARPPVRPEGAGVGTPISAREAEDASMRSLAEATRRGEIPGPIARIELNAEQAMQEAVARSAELEAALQVKAVADLDSTALDAAIQKARQLLSLLSQATAAAMAANSDAGLQLRRNFSD